MTLAIVAYNINRGGGKVLLDQLLSVCSRKAQIIIWLDERNQIVLPGNFKVYRVSPSIWSRFRAELKIKTVSRQGHSFLFFGNLPPLFSLHPSSSVKVFLQNKYLILPGAFNSINMASTIRTWIESLWFKLRFSVKHLYIVQSEHMKELLLRNYPLAKISLLPFFDLPKGERKPPTHEFIYVSSPDAHKNHRQLIAAMIQLAREGIVPRLKLIFEAREFAWLVDLVQKANEEGTRIEVVSSQDRSTVYRHYQQCSCLVFPSTLESFGLPLLEAQALGLDILASEMSFVREFVTPRETFDPNNPESIAMAIKRYLQRSPGLADRESSSYPKTKILTPEEFLERIE